MMRPDASGLVTNPKPHGVIVDFRDIISRFGNWGQDGYFLKHIAKRSRFGELSQFLRAFPVQKFIECSLISPYDLPENDLLPHYYIEHLVSDGKLDLPQEFFSAHFYDWIALYYDALTQAVDTHVRTKIENSQIHAPYTDFLFSHWLTPYASVLTNDTLLFNTRDHHLLTR